MSDDELVREVADRMRATWRGEEDRLLRTARRRVATAKYHGEEASNYELMEKRLRDSQGYRFAHLATRALEHRVRQAASLGLVSRPARDAALRLAPGWTQSPEELLLVATMVLEP